MDRSTRMGTPSPSPWWNFRNEWESGCQKEWEKCRENRQTSHLMGVLNCNFTKLGQASRDSLRQLELAIDATREAQLKNLTYEETERFKDIYSWCYCLCVRALKGGCCKHPVSQNVTGACVRPRCIEYGWYTNLMFFILHFMKYPQKHR